MPMLKTRIDLDAIAHNVGYFKNLVGPDVALMAVVKADAYGHGAVRVAATMERAGADAFGVATVGEAVALRDSGIGKPILAWIWDPEQDLAEPLAAGIDLAVPSLRHAQVLVEAGIPARVYIKVETGMHRAGVDPQQWAQVFALLGQAPHITVLGLMSHLACADEANHPHTDAQAQAFAQALAAARAAGLDCPVNHLCNTPGTLSRPDLHHQQVRVGVGLYGLEPIAGLDHGLRPAMTWAATVADVKPIAAGEGTCYGLTWTAQQPGYLANIPVGYADGLPRAFQGALEVGIGGKRYPQVGRVCMDQIVVYLEDNPFKVSPGEEAIIFGTGGMSATELATAAGTINYEVVCRPTGRTRRIYEGGITFA
ncbi:alanine racemase [Corynebacterium lizhenjunii]|uniref:Alanine racemase n=1 Tax=Corynebacterium lizhenjunii TaxID=2709394 RepID=A0A7T0PCD0_9CORY|nr:alanine racemase [Corynebacterium lizhenjunii]QPK79607.1 alanine racemase [Corynebacterium lizhenjunii]